MKLILVLFLSGVAIATASPTCSDEELNKCSDYDPADVSGDDYEENVEYLNSVCKAMGCRKDYYRRCYATVSNIYMRAMLRQSKKIYDVLCQKQSQTMRQKYFDNAKCLTRETKTFTTECKVRENLNINDDDYCQSVEEYMDCTSGLIGRKCGRDAREVFVAVAPDREFYGC